MRCCREIDELIGKRLADELGRARLVVSRVPTVNPANISLRNVPLKPDARPPVIGLHRPRGWSVRYSIRLVWILLYTWTARIRRTARRCRCWPWRTSLACLVFSGSYVEQRVERVSGALRARSRVDRVFARNKTNRAVRNNVRTPRDRRSSSHEENWAKAAPCSKTH